MVDANDCRLIKEKLHRVAPKSFCALPGSGYMNLDIGLEGMRNMFSEFSFYQKLQQKII